MTGFKHQSDTKERAMVNDSKDSFNESLILTEVYGET
jgi:hypothetical protein